MANTKELTARIQALESALFFMVEQMSGATIDKSRLIKDLLDLSEKLDLRTDRPLSQALVDLVKNLRP